MHVSLFGQDPASDPDLDADFPSLDVSLAYKKYKLTEEINN